MSPVLPDASSPRRVETAGEVDTAQPSPAAHCDLRPVRCTAGQYTEGCRGDACREAAAERQHDYRERASLGDVRKVRQFDRYGIRYPGDTDLTWREQAACKGVPQHIFFPEVGEQYKEARSYCVKCPVKKKCLSFAVVNDCTEGMFGGLTPRQRRSIRRRPVEARCEFIA